MGHYDSSRDWEEEKAQEELIEQINEDLQGMSSQELHRLRDLIAIQSELKIVINTLRKF